LPASGRGVRQGAPPGQTPHQGLIRTMIQLLTFDLDNTLWETEPVVAAAEQTLLEWLDRHAPRFTRQFDAQARRALRGEVLATNPELRHRVTALRIAVLEHGLRKAGYSSEQAGELALAGFEVFLEARHALTFFPHCEPVLEEYFRVIVSADEVGLSKPDPAPFLAALERAGVEPSQALHIGDHPVDDIAGARAVGLHTLWFNRLGVEWTGAEPAHGEVRCL